MNDLEKGDRVLMREILSKAGELGMLGISVPEEYGGFGQSFVTQMLVAETTGAGYSFSVAYMAHCGIGTMPVMYYGNEDQRQRYVTKLASGELIGAYCLTEPGAGSDANSGKTNARLSEDGTHYIINGQKMWITNAGFADTLIVFAKIDNDRVLSAFIIESNSPGVVMAMTSINGNQGSTAQIYFNDVGFLLKTFLARGEKDSGLLSAYFIWEGSNWEPMYSEPQRKLLTTRLSMPTSVNSSEFSFLHSEQ